MVEKTTDNVIQNLTTHRIKKLEQENASLKSYVATVMEAINENEGLFAKLFELEAKLLIAIDVEALCFTLLRELKKKFDLDMVRLWFDSSSFMGECCLSGLSKKDVLWLEQGEIIRMGLTDKKVWLLQLRSITDFPWLELEDEGLASMAVLVLGCGDQSFGVLGLGSQNASRFQPKQSTDFLQHLTQVIGLMLEHALTRERLAMFSVTDSLTGVRNQRFFQPHSCQHLSQWFGKGMVVACIYAEVDSFKQLNDTLGSAMADNALLLVSQKIQSCIRSQDTLIRIENDAFVVFLPACPYEKATEIACRMVASCRMIIKYEWQLSISIGVSFSSQKEDKVVKNVVKEASQAMSVAKALGGSRVEIAEVH